jgi:hypothetical protein
LRCAVVAEVEVSGVEVSGVFKVYFVQYFSFGRNVKEVFGSGLLVKRNDKWLGL